MKIRALLTIVFLGSQTLHGQNIFLTELNAPQVEELNANGSSSIFAREDLSQPRGLVFGPSGDLFVSDFASNTVVEFNSTGSPTVFANSMLNEPQGMAFWNGFLYVANYGGNDIVRFNAAGQGTYFASVPNPIGLAFDSSGNLYVSSQSASSLYKVTPDGSKSVFASPSSGLNHPQQITLGPDGDLFVANNGGDDILEFTPDGQGSVFAGPYYGFRPLGIVYNGSGLFYISAGNEVYAATTNGNVFPDTSVNNGAWMLAVENVPEPSTRSLLVLSIVIWIGRRRGPRGG